MEHGFSERQWLGYFEGTLHAEEAGRMERHLAECPACADFVTRSRNWELQLTAATRHIEPKQFVAPSRLEEMLLAALGRVAVPAESQLRPSIAILLLRRLLEPLLGRRAADQFIEIAMRRASLVGAGDLEPHTWPVFVEHLGMAAGSLGGANTQRMIARAGAQLAAEMM